MKKWLLSIYLLLTCISQSQAKEYGYVLPGLPSGFFSNFCCVLGFLNAYENKGGMVVDFKNQGLFYEADLGPNWWTYYFEPINVRGKKKCTYKKLMPFEIMSLGIYTYTKMSRERGHDLIAKYIKVKAEIQDKVECFAAQNFQEDYLIGVHYRGTDKSVEAPRVTYEDLFSAIRKALPPLLPYKIFVATDETALIDAITREFAEKVIYAEALRSSSNEAVHFAKGGSPYQKGEEVLIDCLLLSRCNLLIRTASNVSTCAGFFNPQLPIVNLNRLYFE